MNTVFIYSSLLLEQALWKAMNSGYVPARFCEVKLIVSFFYSLSTLFPFFQQPPLYIKGKVAI